MTTAIPAPCGFQIIIALLGARIAGHWVSQETGFEDISLSDGKLLIVRLVFSFYSFRSVYIAMTRSIARRHTAQND